MSDPHKGLFTVPSSSDEDSDGVEEVKPRRDTGLAEFAKQHVVLNANRIPLWDQCRKLIAAQAFHARVEGLERHKMYDLSQALEDRKDFIMKALTEIELELVPDMKLPSFLEVARQIAVTQMRVIENARLEGVGRDLYMMAGAMMGLFRADEDVRPTKMGYDKFQVHNFYTEAEQFLRAEPGLIAQQANAYKRKAEHDAHELREMMEREEKRREDEEMDRENEEQANRILERALFDVSRCHYLQFNGWSLAEAEAKCAQEAKEARIARQREQEIFSSPPRSEVDPADLAANLDNIKLEDDLAIHTPVYHPEAHRTPADMAAEAESAQLRAAIAAEAARHRAAGLELADVEMADVSDQRGGRAAVKEEVVEEEEANQGVHDAPPPEQQEQPAALQHDHTQLHQQKQPAIPPPPPPPYRHDDLQHLSLEEQQARVAAYLATAAERKAKRDAVRAHSAAVLRAAAEEDEAAARAAATPTAEDAEAARVLEARRVHEAAMRAAMDQRMEQEALIVERRVEEKRRRMQQEREEQERIEVEREYERREQQMREERGRIEQERIAREVATREKEVRLREELARKNEEKRKMKEAAAAKETGTRTPQKAARMVPIDALFGNSNGGHGQARQPRLQKQQQPPMPQQRTRSSERIRARTPQPEQAPHQPAADAYRTPRAPLLPLPPPPADEWGEIEILVQQPPQVKGARGDYGRPQPVFRQAPPPMGYGTARGPASVAAPGVVELVAMDVDEGDESMQVGEAMGGGRGQEQLHQLQQQQPNIRYEHWHAEVFTTHHPEKYKHRLSHADLQAMIAMRMGAEAYKRDENRRWAEEGLPPMLRGRIDCGQGRFKQMKTGDVKLGAYEDAAVEERPRIRVNYGERPAVQKKLAMKHRRTRVPALLTDLHADKLWTVNAQAAAARERLVNLQISFARNPRKKVTFRDADDIRHKIHLYHMQAVQTASKKPAARCDLTDNGIDWYHMTQPLAVLTDMLKQAKQAAQQEKHLNITNTQYYHDLAAIKYRREAGDCHLGTRIREPPRNRPYHTVGLQIACTAAQDVINNPVNTWRRAGQKTASYREFAVSHRDHKIYQAMKPMQDQLIKIHLEQQRLFLTHAFGFELCGRLADSPCNAGCSHLVLADSLLDRVNTFRFPQTYFSIHQHPLNLSSTFRVMCAEIPIEKLANIEWFMFAYGFDEIVFQCENPQIVAARVIQHAHATMRLYYAARQQLRSTHRFTHTPNFRVFKLPVKGMDPRIKALLLQFNVHLDEIAELIKSTVESSRVVGASSFLPMQLQIVEWETPEILKTIAARKTKMKDEEEKGETVDHLRYNCIDAFVDSAKQQCEMRVGRPYEYNRSGRIYQAMRTQVKVHGLSEEEHNRYY